MTKCQKIILLGDFNEHFTLGIDSEFGSVDVEAATEKFGDQGDSDGNNRFLPAHGPGPFLADNHIQIFDKFSTKNEKLLYYIALVTEILKTRV